METVIYALTFGLCFALSIQPFVRLATRAYFEEKMRYHKELMSLHAAGITKGDYQHGQ